MKDVAGCDKPREAVKQASIRGFPNGETRLGSCPATVFAQTDEAKASITQQFAHGYDTQREMVDRVVGEVWPALQRRRDVGAPFDALVTAARRAKRRVAALAEQGVVRVNGQGPLAPDAALRMLLPSYLHLTLNRLGVGLLHESYIASVVEAALGALTDA